MSQGPLTSRRALDPAHRDRVGSIAINQIPGTDPQSFMPRMTGEGQKDGGWVAGHCQKDRREAGRTDSSLPKSHVVKTGFAGSLRHDIQFAQHFFQMAVYLDLLENIIDCALLINDEGRAFDAHELPAVERFFFPHAIGL